MGPGKAELIGRIAETGSISAAARAMRMSYRRAWQLVEALNHDFREPVVTTAIGGTRGGGAHGPPLRARPGGPGPAGGGKTPGRAAAGPQRPRRARAAGRGFFSLGYSESCAPPP